VSADPRFFTTFSVVEGTYINEGHTPGGIFVYKADPAHDGKRLQCYPEGHSTIRISIRLNIKPIRYRMSDAGERQRVMTGLLIVSGK